jgi:photosystem II stability/assembly factor-like uncharacterized protein
MRIAALILASSALLLGQGAQDDARVRWRSLGGPIGGYYDQLVVQGQRLLLTDRERNWSRSLDEGKTWQRLSPPTSTRPESVTAADRTLYGSTRATVSRSDDFGESWTPCGSLPVGGANRGEISSVGADETHVYAALLRVGMFRSLDRCATWTQVTVPWPADPFQTIKYTAGQRVIVHARGGTYLTTDAGTTWSRLSGYVDSANVVTRDCNGSTLLTNPHGVFRLSENGERWWHLGLSGRFVQALVSPRCREIFAVVKDNDREMYSVVMTRDDGNTWNDASGGLNGHGLNALLVGKDGVVYGSAGGSAFQWDGRSQWRQLGPVETRVESLVIAPWGEMFAGAPSVGFFRAGSRGTEWRRVFTGDGARQPVQAGAGQALFIANPRGYVTRTRDRGVTWEVALQQIVFGFTVTRSGAALAGTQNGIFRSTDQGETWIERSIGLTTFWVQSLTSAPDGTTFAGTRTGDVYRSTDDGDRWRPMDAARPGGGNPVLALVVSKMGTLLAGTYSGIFRWDAVERNWTRLPLVVQGRTPSVTAMLQNPAGVLFAVTNAGMFVSADDGATWVTANEGLGGAEVLSLAVDGNGTVVAGTTAGVFTTALR